MIKTFNNVEIIVAVSENNVIGKDNKLLWHIKEDLKLFKEITDNHYIIMGRKTFESLPNLLPNRHHIILSNNKDYKHPEDNRVTIFYNKEDLFNFIKAKSEKKFFIIGGGQIYKLFLPYVNTLNISRVHRTVEGDTYFPTLKDLDTNWSILDIKEYENFTYFKYLKVNNSPS